METDDQPSPLGVRHLSVLPFSLFCLHHACSFCFAHRRSGPSNRASFTVRQVRARPFREFFPRPSIAVLDPDPFGATPPRLVLATVLVVGEHHQPICLAVHDATHVTFYLAFCSLSPLLFSFLCSLFHSSEPSADNPTHASFISDVSQASHTLIHTTT